MNLTSYALPVRAATGLTTLEMINLKHSNGNVAAQNSGNHGLFTSLAASRAGHCEMSSAMLAYVHPSDPDRLHANNFDALLKWHVGAQLHLLDMSHFLCHGFLDHLEL